MAMKKGSKKVQFSDRSIFLSPKEQEIVMKELTEKGLSFREVRVKNVRDIILGGEFEQPKQPVVPKKHITGNITRSIREVIATHPELSLRQIAEQLNTSKNYVRNIRKMMAKKGDIKPTWRNIK